ncbi:MAG: signal peptide peptidase SppA [Adhaeribacter sp.]
MVQFLKYTLATIVGLFLFSFLMFLVLVGILAAASTEGEVTVEKNSVLELKLDRPIKERADKDLFLAFSDMSGMGSAYGLNEIKAAIRHAKKNDKIRGIYLNVEIVSAGMATLQEIRQELLDFKKSGKFIVAYNDICSEKAYYLTSVADRQYLNPQGALELNGLSSEVLFFKGTLEKLDIEPYIFKVGEYKSAVEPFVLDKMSDASRRQVTSFLNSLNDHSLRNIAKSKGKSFESLVNLSDSMLVRTPEDALKHGLVSHVGYFDEAISFMKKKSGLKEDDKLYLVDFKKYKGLAAKEDEEYNKNKIAVIYAEGEIVNGEGGHDNIGGTKFAEEIRKARKDKNVKAIVLRINSPGGSAMASDVIWREVMLAKKVKPVMASMSDVAASGGYYIAMACDTIVAHPNTITGSIGVFGMFANLAPFLQNKLGITIDRVKTGPYADMPSVTRQLTGVEKQIVQNQVERIYQDFTTKAAQGRHMPVEKLRQVASGRVWSGTEAKTHGLVDVFGSLEDAIKLAAAKAGIKEKYQLRHLPAQKTFIDQIITGMETRVQQHFLRQELGETYPYYEKLRQVQQFEGIQARMPYDFLIQ